jgi:hypothetical protein
MEAHKERSLRACWQFADIACGRLLLWRPVNRAEHSPFRLVGELKQQRRFRCVRLGKRQASVPDGAVMSLVIHATAPRWAIFASGATPQLQLMTNLDRQEG